LPGFREAFEKLGRLIVDVGTQLAKVSDSSLLKKVITDE
jgi:hypothetical protein